MAGAEEFARLVDELDALEAARGEEGLLSPELAARRLQVERAVMAALAQVLGEDERRSHARVPCEIEVRLHYRNSAVGGTIRDAGTGGVLVESPLGPDVGDTIEIEIPRRAGVLEHGLRVRGRVAWRLEPERSGGGYGVGVAFALGDDAQERRLRRFVLELLRRRVAASR